MKKSGFLYGAFILAIVNFIVRTLGFSYKIILSKIIGPEGIGLFQMVFPVLMVFITITTAGIPIAVSKLVAKQNSLGNHYGVKKTFRIAAIITFIIAITLSFIILFFSKYISYELLESKKVYPSIIFLSPAILVISLSSVMRGYFYGLKKINPAGIAQIIEQITRISFVLITIYLLYPVDSKLGAFIAVCGISVGEIFGLLWLLINYKLMNKKNSKNAVRKIPTITVLSQISYIAVPITISRIINVILQMLNAILIPQRLVVAGFSKSEAIATFGRVTGMTMPIIFLPFIVTSALVISIIPNLSEEMALKNYKLIRRNIAQCIRITLFISIPLTMYYIFFSNNISMFFYNDATVGKYIGIMGYSTIFLSLQHTLSGILHGLGKQVITTINYVIGMTFQLIATYFLVCNPSFGINGFFIGFLVSTVSICILHYIVLNNLIKINISTTNYIIKPLISAAISVVTMITLSSYLKDMNVENYVRFLSTFVCGGITYISFLFIIKGIPPMILSRLIPKK